MNMNTTTDHRSEVFLPDSGPSDLISTGLWVKLQRDPRALSSVMSVRDIARKIANTISQHSPEFTDHSVRHMDSLWRITDQVLAEKELDSMSISEVYCLTISFYLHDLGMAACATSEMESDLRASKSYSSVFARLQKTTNLSIAEAEKTALSIAARREHAQSAERLATQMIPGLSRFLIEDSELRNHFGTYIGRISSSHNWDLAKVDRFLGSSGAVAGFFGDQFDPAYLACLLRIADFAHMNKDRADLVDFALRRRLPAESATHWLSQSQILGPIRDANTNQIKFNSSSPIADVDAWWLFFTMVEGLDQEIRAVGRYLARRPLCAARFSLTGVVGSNDPQEFSAFVQPDGFEPVDLRIRPSSIDRLIGLLGGRSLYGNDLFAPVRELVQNAMDAISLRKAIMKQRGEEFSEAKVSIRVRHDDEETTISVTDNGVGMNESTISDYLLGIASDYWNSQEFYSTYPEIASSFVPSGQFGIGFLSVFMIADFVIVETETAEGDRFRVDLRGVGQRGMLKRLQRRGSPGTSITLTLKNNIEIRTDKLIAEVRNRFPAVPFQVSVASAGEPQTLNPGWWRSCAVREFITAVTDGREASIAEKKPVESTADYSPTLSMRHRRSSQVDEWSIMGPWGGAPPEVCDDSGRFVATADSGITLLCLRGIFVSIVESPGMFGLIDLDDLEVDATRARGVGGEWKVQIDSARESLRPAVVTALGSIPSSICIPTVFPLLSSLSRYFGHTVLTETSLPWIGVTTASGSAPFLTPTEFLRELQNHTEVVLAIGCGPWSVWKRRERMFREAGASALHVPLSEELLGFQVEKDWDGPKDIVEGPLETHILSVSRRLRLPSDDEEDGPAGGPLRAILELLKMAWSVESLEHPTAVWRRHTRDGQLTGWISRTSV